MWPLLNFAAFIAVSGFAVYWFAAVVYSRITYIRLGKPHELKQDLDVRIREFLIQVFGQKKLLKDKKSGMMHMVMFYGFIILQFGAVELIVKGFIKGFELPLGAAHPYFSLTQEVTTFLVLLAVAYASTGDMSRSFPGLNEG